MIFSSGAAVEVNLKIGVGTEAAWIPAKVLKETGNNSYLVEYQSPSKGVVGEHQQKTVDIHLIRPVPPGFEKRYIGLLDKVEAFYDFGWQSGFVTKLLPRKRYKVFFKDRVNMEDMELSRSELRIPLIWKDGTWLTAKDVISLVPDEQREQERAGIKNGQKSEMSTRPIKKLKEGNEEVLPKCQPEEQLHGLANPTATPCYGYISSKKSLVDDPSPSNAERPLKECKQEFIVEQESGLTPPLKTRGRKYPLKKNRNGGGAADMAVEHSKSTGEAGLDSQSIVNQENESSGRDEKLEAAVIHATCHSAQIQDESFCFAKKSAFWKQFEDMALFKKMPQNPHFNPLKDFHVGFREGKAVGYMMSFIDLAEQASGLTIDDPRSAFANLLENLRELEVVGFDVKALQDQVNKVLTVKLKKSNLLILTQEIGKRLAEHEQKKAECDEMEDALEKGMKELKEKYTSVVAKKHSEEFEITVLRSCIADVEEMMNHLGNEF